MVLEFSEWWFDTSLGGGSRNFEVVVLESLEWGGSRILRVGGDSRVLRVMILGPLRQWMYTPLGGGFSIPGVVFLESFEWGMV